ncbi:hypothetical protein [Pararhodonellum marinum]|uniref:hypothetical protein n=1 Tax=Pararhodonellum marinum TaxID=2755358 RepID=UPI00188EBAB6|nr:hypothetical protein [Pararhodonellum marinum]
MWRKLRRSFTAERFALSPVWVQLLTIFVVSGCLIFLFSPLLGDLATSYRIFADPANYALAEGPMQLGFGLVLVLLGLVLFSFIISVLSAALVELIANIRRGSLPFRRSGHILFINYNIKLPLILDQFNLRAKEKGMVEPVVLLFSKASIVSGFRAQFSKDRWPFLDIYLRQGDVMAFSTYERLSIFKALGLVLLLPDHEEDKFSADNYNLKILTSLTNDQAFFKHLSDRQLSRRPMKCAIELSNQPDSRNIAMAMTAHDSGSLFSVITPGDVIGSILSRAKVDVVYYKVFFEILSMDGNTIQFIDPKRLSKRESLTGQPFEDLMFCFKGGTLLGYSRVNEAGRFEMNLCPFGEKLGASDWLIFMTENVNGIKYASGPPNALSLKHEEIFPPNEFASKRICVIGDTWPLGNMADFMDLTSLEAMQEAHFVFAEPNEYLKSDFHKKLQEADYDNLIINLDDELGFRLTMLLVSANRKNSSFLSKIVTILSDPVTEQLLSKNLLKSNTILSHKLSARYIAQLSFQKNLDRLFKELAYPEGAEFNLLEVGKHIPRDLLKNSQEVKQMLAAHQLIYLGTVDRDKNIHLGASDFDDTQQILVLSQGEV